MSGRAGAVLRASPAALLSATTVMLRLTTGFDRADRKEELTSLRLSGRSDMVTVGTFEVGR